MARLTPLVLAMTCIIFPLSTCGYQRFDPAVIRKLIMEAAQKTGELEKTFFSNRKRTSQMARLPSYIQIDPDIQEISQAASFHRATLLELQRSLKKHFKKDLNIIDLLSRKDTALIRDLSHCPPAPPPAVCQHVYHSLYRTLSGVCNNRQYPLWGAARSALVRWLPAQYEDGLSEPKGWNPGWLYNGFQLPPPWDVSKMIMRTRFKWRDLVYSGLLYAFGQFIAHDVSQTPHSTNMNAFSTVVNCVNVCENKLPCFPVKPTGLPGCLPLHRSTPACISNQKSDVREALQQQQINRMTSFLDASVIYGSNQRVENSLRDLSGRNGKLKVNEEFQDPVGRSYLPFGSKRPSVCSQGPGGGPRVECFSVGDGRGNEGLGLSILHTLWLREHNRIAEELKCLNDHWSPEMVYQETRKIIGAQFQIIVMRDYLPKIIGPDSFKYFIGPYSGYDPTIESTTANVFSTAAFRFGHGTVPPVVQRLNESFQVSQHIPPLQLRNTFFSPWRIVKEGGIEPVLRGMIGTAAYTVSAKTLLTEEVTDKLLIPNVPHRVDLASANLQRGRDHGLPGYNDFREFCGLSRIKTLKELQTVIRDGMVAKKILAIYKHLDNIDVWLGGLSEQMLPGARTGPLFSCLIAKQMKALRDGDRFWWEAEGVFTPEQRDQLSKASLSRIICENSEVKEVPIDSFILGKYPYAYVSCDHVPALDLSPWKEEKSKELERCGSPGKINNGDFILSSKTGKLLALYTCYHGFKLKGPSVICCEGYRWSQQPPRCIEEKQ